MGFRSGLFIIAGLGFRVWGLGFRVPLIIRTRFYRASTRILHNGKAVIVKKRFLQGLSMIEGLNPLNRAFQ